MHNLALPSIVLSYGPLIIRSGEAGEGGFAKVMKVNDTFKTKVGVGGQVTRILQGDKLYQVELTLGQAGHFNGLLQAALNADEKAAFSGLPGAGVSTFQIADLAGRITFYSPSAWIRKPAEDENTNDAIDKVWIFDMDLDGGLFALT